MGRGAPDTPVSTEPGPIADNSIAGAPQPSGDDQCNAAIATGFAGREVDAATKAELEASVAPIAAIRWVGPGTMTTEDYSPSRLNVMLDTGNRITSAHCG